MSHNSADVWNIQLRTWCAGLAAAAIYGSSITSVASEVLQVPLTEFALKPDFSQQHAYTSRPQKASSLVPLNILPTVREVCMLKPGPGNQACFLYDSHCNPIAAWLGGRPSQPEDVATEMCSRGPDAL